MSVASDILLRIQTVDSSSSATLEDITSTIKSDAWELASAFIQTNQASANITNRSVTDSFTAAEEILWGLDHFKSDIRDIIKLGKVVMPYKCLKSGIAIVVIYTKNKVYKFPTNNVNYFNATITSVKHYGAQRYFQTQSEAAYATTAQNSGNAIITNYNYTQ